MAGTKPGLLDVPQSPETRFPDEDRPRQQVDVDADIRSQEGAIASTIAGFKPSELGTNRFRYAVRAEIRLEPLEEVPDPAGGTLFQPAGPATVDSVAEETPVYHSKLTLVPEKSGAKPRDVERGSVRSSTGFTSGPRNSRPSGQDPPCAQRAEPEGG